MTDEKGFADFMDKIVAGELAPREHPQHPDEELLLDSLAGTLAPGLQARLSAHLATCAPCRARWTQLFAATASEATRFGEKAQVPSLAALVRERRRKQARGTKKWKERARQWPRSLVPWAAVRPAFAPLAAAVVAVAVTLSVAVPFLRTPLVASNEAYADLRAQMAELEQRVAGLPEAVARFVSLGGYTSSFQRPDLPSDPGEIVAEAEKLADGAQRALYVVGALQAQGLLDASRLNWGSFKTFEAVLGETWADIATFAFGMPQLWPLVWVLNSEVAGPDDPLPGGAQIRVPSKARSQ